MINHLHLDVPMEQVQTALDEGEADTSASQLGFQHFYLLKEAHDRATVNILCENGEAAAAGARFFGPTWFAALVAPILASEQVRITEEIIVARWRAANCVSELRSTL